MNSSTCGLMLIRRIVGVALEAGHLDLVVEVTDVAQDRLVLHRLHVLEGDDVLVAGGGDDDVGPADGLLDGLDLEAVHQRLQRVDRVDLGDRDARALRLERLGAALADVAVAADQRGLAADQDVGAAVDAVDQRVPGAVLVVELALGDRVVDVDGRERQLTGGGELVEPQHAGGGLLGDALDRLGDLGPLGLVGLEALRGAAPGTPCTRRSRRPRRWAARRRPSRTARRAAPAWWRRRRRRGSCWRARPAR